MYKQRRSLHLFKLFTLLILFISIFFTTSCHLFREDNPVVIDPTKEIIPIDNLTQYDFHDSLKTNGPLTERHLPSKGDVNVLVVPISFDPEAEDPKLLNDINLAFNGTEEDTGYHSVSSFYKESSYGKLNLKFDVTDYYKPKKTALFYEKNNVEYGTTTLYREILRHFDSTMDFKKYDNDSDGYIDTIWMIYTHPVDTSDFWWAYVATDTEINTNDGVKGYVHGFAGTDFLDPNYRAKYKKYPLTGVKLDTHTYIHETGHMFGLDDYYDYDSIQGVNTGGTYGFDYMDHNYGDHGPINKLLLDWVDPIIVNDVCDVEIKPYQTTGEVYLLTRSFTGTIYDSYYLIINYSNDGLYKKDPYFKLKTLTQEKEANGILVYEINAEKNIEDGVVKENGGEYSTGFKYDNSDEKKLFVNILGTKPDLRDEMLDLHLNLLLTKGEELVIPNTGLRLKVNSLLDNKNISVSFK